MATTIVKIRLTKSEETQGMNPAAALAFLVAGPTTTLPAMAAVWLLVTRRVFAIYISLALMGATLVGYAFHIVSVTLA